MNLKTIKNKIATITKKGLFKDASWMLIARLINVVIQAAYFIIVARALGTENYGSFVGVTSLASLFFPFAALGSDSVLVKEVSVNRNSFASYWGNTLLVLSASSIGIILFLILISPLIFSNSISILTIALILLADLSCLGLIEASSKAFRSVDLVSKTAQLVVLNTAAKLVAALCMVFLFKPSGAQTHVGIDTWAVLYFVSSISVGLVALIGVNSLAGKPKLNVSRIRADVNQGIYFSIGFSANNINSNIDKTMLASMASLDATGIYGSAYRFINIGNVPVLSLFNATYPRFFQQGNKGVRNCFKFAKKLLPILIGYGVISIIGFQVFAPLIPKILGAEYADSVTTLRWLAPLPAMIGLQLVAADTLTGSNHQKARSHMQVVAAIINILLNLWLIPRYGLFGAIWATLASDTIKLVGLWTILFFVYRSESKNYSGSEN